MHFRAFDFVAGCPQTNRWKLNLQTEIGHGSSSCFDPGRGWLAVSQSQRSYGLQKQQWQPAAACYRSARHYRCRRLSKNADCHIFQGYLPFARRTRLAKTYMSTHVNTCQQCQHMSTHVNTCQHMSTHVNTCQHMSTHVNTLTCQYSKCNLLGLDQGACVGFVGKV